MLNQVTLIGNVGNAPVLRESNGDQYATFSLATTKYWTDESGERHEDTQWHSCVLWRKDLAPFAEKVGKGTLLLVQGELIYRQDEQDGVRRTWANVRVRTWRRFPNGATPNAEAADTEPDDDEAEAEEAVA